MSKGEEIYLLTQGSKSVFCFKHSRLLLFPFRLDHVAEKTFLHASLIRNFKYAL